jgi:type IV secretory pathway TrbD component
MNALSEAYPAGQRDRVLAVITGVAAGAVVLVLLDWTAAEWVAHATQSAPVLPTLFGALLFAACALAAVIRPTWGLVAGATLAVLWVLGLLLWKMRDVLLVETYETSPTRLLVYAVEMPLVPAAAGMLVAIGITSLRSRTGAGRRESVRRAGSRPA